MSKHCFAALFFVITAAIFAQVERATVIGNVTDATGAVAPGMTVTVTLTQRTRVLPSLR